MKLIIPMSFICLVLSCFIIYCTCNSIQTALEIQVLLSMVEFIIFLIPSIIIPEFEGYEYLELAVRIAMLIIVNGLLSISFESISCSLAIFSINGFIFILLSFVMFSGQNEEKQKTRKM